MAEELAEERMITCLHEDYTATEVIEWGKDIEKNVLEYVSLTAGNTDESLYQTKDILAELPEIKFILVDVSNDPHQDFIQKMRMYRHEFPDKIIIASNIESPQMSEALC